MQRRGFLNSLLGLPVAARVVQATPTTVEPDLAEQPETSQVFLVLDGRSYEVIAGYTEDRQVPISEAVARFMTVKTRERICGTFRLKGTLPEHTTIAALGSPVSVMNIGLRIPAMNVETQYRIWITSVWSFGSGDNRQFEIEYQLVS